MTKDYAKAFFKILGSNDISEEDSYKFLEILEMFKLQPLIEKDDLLAEIPPKLQDLIFLILKNSEIDIMELQLELIDGVNKKFRRYDTEAIDAIKETYLKSKNDESFRRLIEIFTLNDISFGNFPISNIVTSFPTKEFVLENNILDTLEPITLVLFCKNIGENDIYKICEKIKESGFRGGKDQSIRFIENSDIMEKKFSIVKRLFCRDIILNTNFFYNSKIDISFNKLVYSIICFGYTDHHHQKELERSVRITKFLKNSTNLSEFLHIEQSKKSFNMEKS